MLTITDIKNRITPICQKYGIQSLYLFGSYARGEATAKSDVDLRVNLGNKLRGLAVAGFYADIEDVLSCDIDIMTTKQLSPRFLKAIEKDEIQLYKSPELGLLRRKSGS